MNPKICSVVTMLLACVVLTGCQQSQRTTSPNELYGRYNQTTLKLSNSSDVLAVISDPEIELLSQSQNVVASWGSDKKAVRLWFNAVAFDEEELTAVRKYCFWVNEKTRGYFVMPTKKVWFEAELVLDEDMLEEPYADANARRVAILKGLLTHFSEDMAQITADSRTLKSAVMTAEQTINNITLSVLELSPALAAKLSDAEGLEFDHVKFGPGKIRMTEQAGIVRLRIKIGKNWFNRPNTMEMI